MAEAKKLTFQEALVTALAEMPNPVKNADNPAFKRNGNVLRYADLEATLDACKPILAANGIAIVQMPVSEPGGVGVHTQLVGHGEVMDCGSFILPLAKNDPQGAGAAITYARRYALTALFGLAQEDDDANSVSQPGNSGKTYGAGKPPVGSADPKVLKRIYAKRKGLGISDAMFAKRLKDVYGVERDSELASDQADDLLTKLAALEKQREAKDDPPVSAEVDIDDLCKDTGELPPDDADEIPF
jgi:hypothetical protein